MLVRLRFDMYLILSPIPPLSFPTHAFFPTDYALVPHSYERFLLLLAFLDFLLLTLHRCFYPPTKIFIGN